MGGGNEKSTRKKGGEVKSEFKTQKKYLKFKDEEVKIK